MRPLSLLIPIALCVACSSVPLTGAQSDSSRSRFGDSTVAEQLTIQTASTSLEVDDLSASVAKVEALVVAKGGSVSSSSIREASATLRVRVPSAQLRPFLDSVSELGDERNRNTTSEDVTDAYSDLEAEIENLRALRDRLRALLERAQDVKEVLQVERELTRVQTQLDSLDARKKRMTNDIQRSAVSLDLFEKQPDRILGPLGMLYEGTRWFVKRLFVLYP